MSEAIEFFFDPISPYSYLATTRINAIAARHGRRVIWRPTLVGVTMVKVMGLKPVPETPLKSAYSRHDLLRQAAMMDVPLKFHGLSGVNSLAASRAYLWLKERDEDAAQRLVQRASAALWAEAFNITEPEAMAELAKGIGIDTDGMVEAIRSDEFKEALKQAFDYALSKNVFGVPFFIADGEPLWGVDRLWMLDHWLGHGAWPKLGEA